MLSIVVAMVVIVAVAALVLYYVAYPHREGSEGEGTWLGRALRRARGSMRTLGDPDDRDDPPAR